MSKAFDHKLVFLPAHARNVLRFKLVGSIVTANLCHDICTAVADLLTLRGAQAHPYSRTRGACAAIKQQIRVVSTLWHAQPA